MPDTGAECFSFSPIIFTMTLFDQKKKKKTDEETEAQDSKETSPGGGRAVTTEALTSCAVFLPEVWDIIASSSGQRLGD